VLMVMPRSVCLDQEPKLMSLKLEGVACKATITLQVSSDFPTWAYSIVRLLAMAGDVPAPKAWTLDEWDRAFDWGDALPKEAAAFLRSQGLQGNFENLSSDVLRCVGFTKLYETGRIGPPIMGGGARQLEERNNTKLGSKQSLDVLMAAEKDRLETLRGKEKFEISARGLTGRTLRFKVRPSADVKMIREHISYREGVLLPPLWHFMSFRSWPAQRWGRAMGEDDRNFGRQAGPGVFYCPGEISTENELENVEFSEMSLKMRAAEFVISGILGVDC
jgi:hypothetical protein